jgi:hypothetical protein
MTETTAQTQADSVGRIRKLQTVLVLTFVLFASGCQPQAPTDQPTQGPPITANTSAPTSPTRDSQVTITRVDGLALTVESRPQVGHTVMVEGTTNNPDAVICVLVHPLQSDTWWVQNLPGLPDQQPDGTWSWRTSVFCGTERLGVGEDFELLAVAEDTQALCVPSRQVKVAEANILLRSIPRSRTIVVHRVAE